MKRPVSAIVWVDLGSDGLTATTWSAKPSRSTKAGVWHKLTAPQWKPNVQEVYGPAQSLSADELFSIYVSHAHRTFRPAMRSHRWADDTTE